MARQNPLDDSRVGVIVGYLIGMAVVAGVITVVASLLG